ncbi:MAG: lytic transglycosylase domain-containing protein [Legionellales bacterium]|nr:lytic transglycosylase domain-containing protein [Legionellales bacterium]
MQYPSLDLMLVMKLHLKRLFSRSLLKNSLKSIFILLFFVLNFAYATHLNNLRWKTLAQHCAPTIHPRTLAAVILHESNFNSLSININGNYQLSRQPRTKSEAIQTAQFLLHNGFNFDVGLGQINSANFSRLKLDINNAFDPCVNLHAASEILSNCYQRASSRLRNKVADLTAALSCYNTGNFERGLQNGYVNQVIKASEHVPDIIILNKNVTATPDLKKPITSKSLLPISPKRVDQDLFAKPDTDIFQLPSQTGEII